VRERSISSARRAIVEGVAELLGRKEFKLLEAGVRMAGTLWIGSHRSGRSPSPLPL
jgi:hypothetical protein